MDCLVEELVTAVPRRVIGQIRALTDEQRLEYYAIINRMINRGCNDTLHAERTLYANAFRAGKSLLSGFVIESGVMEHRYAAAGGARRIGR